MFRCRAGWSVPVFEIADRYCSRTGCGRFELDVARQMAVRDNAVTRLESHKIRMAAPSASGGGVTGAIRHELLRYSLLHSASRSHMDNSSKAHSCAKNPAKKPGGIPALGARLSEKGSFGFSFPVARRPGRCVRGRRSAHNGAWQSPAEDRRSMASDAYPYRSRSTATNAEGRNDRINSRRIRPGSIAAHTLARRANSRKGRIWSIARRPRPQKNGDCGRTIAKILCSKRYEKRNQGRNP